ncbi:ABC transporter [Clostridium bornimense]|uniref:ABC transporter n=1 Tax=Clostridium bornimense TaxID=1216932 RepID=W6SK83_9CLOT|nr:ABC transporter ATP-binding protein [Clostridium bornimense]CDM70230.1 ABC transporter [Clostridium bornimense]
MEDIISVKNLKKTYNNIVAVNDISFSVKKGEFFGLLGHNGAGKSTTIDCILGLKAFDSGVVKILNKDPRKSRKEIFEKIGVQLQLSSYPDKIKVYEICEETAALYSESCDYNQLLKKFSLDKVKKNYVSTLSGGEKQKLAVILALIPNPEVVFLDELTTGLDVEARRDVWKLLKSLKKEKVTMLLTSHYMDEVEALCDKIVIIKNGKLLALGTVEEIITSSPYDNLEDAYLWYMDKEVQ